MAEDGDVGVLGVCVTVSSGELTGRGPISRLGTGGNARSYAAATDGEGVPEEAWLGVCAMGGGGSSCLDWVDASDGVREWASAGRRGEEGNTVRVLGLRKGTRRKVDVLRGDVGGTADDGPATGCEDEEAALFGGVNEVAAGDGAGDNDGE